MNTFHIINTLKNKASQMAYNTSLYDWSLHTNTSPDRLVVKPVDPWRGDSIKAQELLEAAGVIGRTGPQWFDEWWTPEGYDDIWISHIHSFSWLRDLRTLGGAQAKEQGRLMIESWIDNYPSWNAHSWRSDILGRRLSMWVCHYDYFCDGFNEDFDDRFLGSLVKQAKHLSNILNAKEHGSAHLQAIKGLLYAGIALEEYKKWVTQGLGALDKALNEQILPDGGHISRSPAYMLDVLEILVDIRSALQAAAYPEPDNLATKIGALSAALRTLRCHDRKLALFHSSQEGNTEDIDSILAQAGTQTKPSKSLPDTGYERIELGRSLLIMDTGATQKFPYDKHGHASPLAFELSYGKERLLVSCGSHPTSSEWKDALRFTAAHNTACLDYRNACELRKDGHFGRKVTYTDVQRENTKDAALITVSHNGYVPLNGITHTRKIYMSKEGHDIRGEDDFICGFELVKPVEIALRFHIHPNVTASLINEGKEVLLRMRGGIGWRFKYDVGELKLEDSVYIGKGIIPRKTSQIVVYGKMSLDNAFIKWSFKREEL
ncbi:MAG: heparinase II/III family protein [Alphaproteobacteria bacterium]